MAGMNWITNIYLWMGLAFAFLILFICLLIFLIVLSKKTHAIIEFKAWTKGIPIAMFFQDNRYVEWKPIKPEAGILTDSNFGAFIINEKATYIDKKTKNVIIPFDANFGASLNVRAAKLIDDLQYIIRDEDEFKKLRYAIANNLIEDSESITTIKSSVYFGTIKTMLTALLPHNINSKIEKIIAARMKGYGKINVPQVLLIFAGMLGAILLGALIIKMAFGK